MSDRPFDTPFTESDYESFIECVVDSWKPSWHPKQTHDVIIDHPDGRQIRIDTAHNRLSYRDRQDDHWGIREKPVSDLQTSAETLMTVAMRIDMPEIRLLGLEEPPERPAEPVTSFE